MNGAVPATYYGADAARPHPAEAEWVSTGVIAIRLADRTETWDLRAPGTTWEISAGALRITHGAERHVIIVKDPIVVKSWTAHLRTHRIRKSREGRTAWLLTLPLALPLGLIVVGLAVYFWVLPWASERLAMKLPPEVDVQLGDPMFEGMRSGLDIDTAGSATLQAFADKLVIAPTFKLRLHLVKDDQVNAFAMPGGHIVVFTGILEKMDRAGQLAALLAHEGTHVEKRHSTRGLARDLAGSFFLALVLGDGSGLGGLLAQKGDELKGLDYSRDLETEADTIGIARLRESGVDPEGMVALLELLEREAGDMPEGTSFLSSHPLTKDRITLARAKASAAGATRSASSELDSLFSVLKGRIESH
ncbi:MAG: M48 family metallopeptidase [Bacteroidetes bacterium]|jgi:predicted Zn-dependent protease|nr:M48 family metallopeptidase [Bacteroidota bacterium]HMU14145.1 M48 family metallopeptidase [Flavobacteriales bacterium]